MQITLNDGNIRTSPAMLEFVQSQVGAAFRALGDRIHSVTVSISDLNGPKRGVDKACRVSAGVAGFGVISVRAVGPDFYGAIRDAIRKAARAASHRVRRSH